MTLDAVAEGSALGSLLVRPQPLTRVRGWLRPDDFADPWNQQLYKLLLERHTAGQLIEPEALGLSLMKRVGPQRADLPRLVGLMQITPARPQPEVYGRMVLELSLRREVALQGVLLRACALSAVLEQCARPVAVGADMVDQVLREGERRWQLASGASSSPSTTHPELAPALRNLDRYLSSDRFLSAHAAETPQLVQDDERATVAAAICHPEQLPEISRWLHPEHLTDPSWRAAYEALLFVAETDKLPVDALTVAWSLGRDPEHRGPAPRELMTAVNEALNSDPAYYSRRVAGHVLKRTASASAQLLESAASNRGLGIPELYATGEVATAAVRSAAVPLTRGSHLHVVPEAQPAQRVPGQVAG